MQQPILKTSELSIGYQQGKGNRRHVAGPLDLEIFAGEMICLLGPNGCGKSTLLRTIASLQNSLGGKIEITGENLSQLKPAQLARKISLVLTENVAPGNLDVYSLIALGRYPYSGWLGVLDKKDREVIDQVIQSTGMSEFLGRKMGSLSDGERQKVMLARAMAQDTPLVVLDEPTAHLDLPSRIQLMRLLHQLAKETKKAILISTHELDLALQVADQIWLMQAGGSLSAGLPEELVLNGSFQRAFDKEGILFDPSTGTFNIHQPGQKRLTVNGNGPAAFWTKRAFIRHGYRIVEEGETDLVVNLTSKEGKIQWEILSDGQGIEYAQLAELLRSIE